MTEVNGDAVVEEKAEEVEHEVKAEEAKPEPPVAAGEISEVQADEKNIVVDEGKQIDAKTEEVDESKKEAIKEETSSEKPKAGKVKAEPKRNSRERKSADSFKPDDFLNVDKTLHIIKGRGTALAKLEGSRRAIENTPITAEVYLLAHRLLYSGRTKLPKKDIKANILRFSGFLTAEVDPDPDKQKELDMDEEAKMGQRAYKLKVSDIKKICDFLGIDRSGVKDKDTFVDILLDFLGEPGDKLLKFKEESRKNKRKSQAVEDDDDSDDETESEDSEVRPKKGKPSPKKSKSSKKSKSKTRMPTDGELRRWVNAYILCHNMEKSTLKHALEIAGEKFGVNLTSEKAKLKQFLADAL